VFNIEDSLHVEDLGVYRTVAQMIEAYLLHIGRPAAVVATTLTRLNARLHLVPRSSNFPLPAGRKGAAGENKNFCDAAKVQAIEHRNVHQLLAHLVAGLLPAPFCELVAL
jgi:hypothetical protein